MENYVKITIYIFCVLLSIQHNYGQNFTISSPNDQLDLSVNIKETILWSVSIKSMEVINNSLVTMVVFKNRINANRFAEDYKLET